MENEKYLFNGELYWYVHLEPFLQRPVKVNGHLTKGILPVLKSINSQLVITDT